MDNANKWLDVNAAAALVGRSVSTIRRMLPEIEQDAPQAIRREPLEGKGGAKVLLSKDWLLAHFGAPPDQEGPPDQSPQYGAGRADVVAILEKQLDAKDKQIGALHREIEAKSRQIEDAQRVVSDLSEKLGQFAALNASLAQKLVTAATTTDTQPDAPKTPHNQQSAPHGDRYPLALAVVLSLVLSLLIWFVLQWMGNQ